MAPVARLHRDRNVRALRDRALIATLTYSFARIGAPLMMKVEDLPPRGSGWQIRPHGKGGKHHLLWRTMRNRAAESPLEFSPKQGQYLAFIHAYKLVNGRPPAQADMQRFFPVTPPAVHQMLLTLEKAGLISRQPGVPRCIAVTVDRDQLPRLHSPDAQPVKSYVRRYSHVRQVK